MDVNHYIMVEKTDLYTTKDYFFPAEEYIRYLYHHVPKQISFLWDYGHVCLPLLFAVHSPNYTLCFHVFYGCYPSKADEEEEEVSICK